MLAPSLERFARTPEFPEIAEAQSLLAALVETDAVKTAAAARQRRLKLQTDYQAVMWSEGFLADETKVAFARARELTAGADNCRAANAHAVLAPALEGFSPTPEFLAVAEAQVLLETLAEDVGKQQARASQPYLQRLLEATGKTFTEHIND